MLRNHSWFHRTLLLLIGLLLLSSLSFTSVSSPMVQAQVSVEPVLDIPPSYYRPGLDNWLVTHMVRQDRNDPINIIVYGPPDKSRFDPLEDTITAVRAANDIEYPDWYWNKRDLSPPYYIPGVQEKCYNELGYAPLDDDPDREISGMWTNTECPALTGLGERLRFRHWDYFSAEWEINASYLSASFTENYAVPYRCSNKPPLGASHCLTNFDDGRDTVDQLIRIGANNLGWKVRSHDKSDAYPRHQNIQPGPYDGVEDWRNRYASGCNALADPTCPLEENPDDYILFASGDVRVICIDKDPSSDYCDQKPAERPLSIGNLIPNNGNFLGVGRTANFSVDIGYSDELREIKEVTFALNYIDSANNPQTTTQNASLASGDGNDGVWKVALPIPDDVALDLATGTQIAGLEIEICDNHGQQTGNADDTACWEFRNLRYVLRDLPDCTDTTFVFDTTASMDGILDDVQAAATEVIGQIFTANPNARVAVVEYRDGTADAFGARTVLALSGDQSAIVNAINSLSPDGGGDGPEFVLSGVMEAVNLSWREPEDKVILLIGDAEAKDPEPLTGHTTSSVTSAATAEGIAVYGLPQGSFASASFNPLANGTRGAIYPISDKDTAVEAIRQACNLP